MDSVGKKTKNKKTSPSPHPPTAAGRNLTWQQAQASALPTRLSSANHDVAKPGDPPRMAPPQTPDAEALPALVIPPGGRGAPPGLSPAPHSPPGLRPSVHHRKPQHRGLVGRDSGAAGQGPWAQIQEQRACPGLSVPQDEPSWASGPDGGSRPLHTSAHTHMDPFPRFPPGNRARTESRPAA